MTDEDSSKKSNANDGLVYLSGFANSFESEVIPGALPKGRNNPRQVPYGTYAEQLSGTAFTAPRAENRRTWLYRIQPSAAMTESAVPLNQVFGGTLPRDCQATVDPLRWKPLAMETGKDFISGMKLMCTAGDPSSKHGLSIYMYTMDQDMADRHFYNADGDMLIVPQQGGLEILTEVGRLRLHPKEIAVVPRGIVMQVNLLDASARGYVLEVFRGAFSLPEMGPIVRSCCLLREKLISTHHSSFRSQGSNGLANARDFLHPTAWCVQDQATYKQECKILVKMDSELFQKTSDHSPFNVVAWHGNYLPYKYNLENFCAVNSVTYDHLDPSIYTVLTCQTDQAGTALADFVIFPPRVMATDSNTLRPPWFHRNTMSEYMGLIYGSYDAKLGFVQGGASLHNIMTPHGPDSGTYEKAVADECKQPVFFDAGLAFMFETCLPLKVAPGALQDSNWRDMEYATCWSGLEDQFTAWNLFDGNKGK
jgi:homogentisate 1,2-dioxygenase